MIDLALDKTTHDLLVRENDLQLVSGLDQVEQNLKERLLFYRREWFLDTTEGVPFFDEILVKNPNVPNIESILKAKILDTEDVIELLEFQTTFDAAARTLTVVFKARTIYGVADLSLSLF